MMVRLGLIGSISQVTPYAVALDKIPNTRLEGIFNTSCEDLTNDQYPLRTISVYENLLAVSDAVVISSDEKKFFKYSLQALKASKHVFLKPTLLENKSQANQLLKLANEAHVTIMVEKDARFITTLKEALPQIKNLKLIEMNNHLSGNEYNSHESVLKTIIYDLDIIHAVLKSNLKNLKTWGVKMINGSPDIINVRLEYDNGCVVILNCSRMDLENKHFALFIQQDRITKVDFLSEEITMLKPEKNNSNNSFFVLNPVKKKVSSGNPLVNELSHFIDCITNNTKSLSHHEDGFKSLFIAERILDNLNKVLAS